jgi:hypothetical protein
MTDHLHLRVSIPYVIAEEAMLLVPPSELVLAA